MQWEGLHFCRIFGFTANSGAFTGLVRKDVQTSSKRLIVNMLPRLEVIITPDERLHQPMCQTQWSLRVQKWEPAHLSCTQFGALHFPRMQLAALGQCVFLCGYLQCIRPFAHGRHIYSQWANLAELMDCPSHTSNQHKMSNAGTKSQCCIHSRLLTFASNLKYLSDVSTAGRDMPSLIIGLHGLKAATLFTTTSVRNGLHKQLFMQWSVLHSPQHLACMQSSSWSHFWACIHACNWFTSTNRPLLPYYLPLVQFAASPSLAFLC